MKNFYLHIIIMAMIIFGAYSCQKSSSPTQETPSVSDLLTAGLWEISVDSQQGLVGSQYQFLSDGNGTVFMEEAPLFSFQWMLESDDKILSLTVLSNGQVVTDRFDIVEINQTNLILLNPISYKQIVFVNVINQ